MALASTHTTPHFIYIVTTKIVEERVHIVNKRTERPGRFWSTATSQTFELEVLAFAFSYLRPGIQETNKLCDVKEICGGEVTVSVTLQCPKRAAERMVNNGSGWTLSRRRKTRFGDHDGRALDFIEDSVVETWRLYRWKGNLIVHIKYPGH